jgi:hypothetical protein
MNIPKNSSGQASVNVIPFQMSMLEGFDTWKSNVPQESQLNLEFQWLSMNTPQNTSFQFFADVNLFQISMFEGFDTPKKHPRQALQPTQEYKLKSTEENSVASTSGAGSRSIHIATLIRISEFQPP